MQSRKDARRVERRMRRRARRDIYALARANGFDLDTRFWLAMVWAEGGQLVMSIGASGEIWEGRAWLRKHSDDLAVADQLAMFEATRASRARANAAVMGGSE